MFGRRRQRANLKFNQDYWHHFSNNNPYVNGMYSSNVMRQQSFQNYPAASGNWNPYFHPYSTHNQQAFPNNYPFLSTSQESGYNPTPYQSQSYSGYETPYYGSPPQMNQSIFHNPLEPAGESFMNKSKQPTSNPYMNPYPKQSFIPKQPSGVQTLMNSFKGQDGSIDVNKMVDTAGQMMNAVNQVSSMVKGIGGIFKT